MIYWFFLGGVVSLFFRVAAFSLLGGGLYWRSHVGENVIKRERLRRPEEFSIDKQTD